jgi:hypothetical protein
MKTIVDILIVYVAGGGATLLVLTAVDESNDVWMPNWAIMVGIILWPLSLALLLFRGVLVIWAAICAATRAVSARKTAKRINDRNIERRSYGGDPT